MLRIGLVGEAPVDTACVKTLLSKKYKGLDFFEMISDIRGNHLDSQFAKRFLRREFEIAKPDFIVFIRDLDGKENNADMLSQRKEFFARCNSIVNKTGLFLLNIQELEALLFTDISVINKCYNVVLAAVDDCMLIEGPKEYLRSNVRGYIETHNKELFEKYNYETIISNCRYFKKFDAEFSIKTGFAE
ncbi:hypothetical protein QTN47_06340 [Danxiaibacter flavus]|uniref:Uncharacterized protein n=1 Tax=Danxiaibacter flavus TaxID=3049108 RepID=A0ABV3ZD39_9BACT|nr:hypothetical protein QNM32_06340 [Chitinophagaceae bacterium DXS]